MNKLKGGISIFLRIGRTDGVGSGFRILVLGRLGFYMVIRYLSGDVE